MYTGFEDLKKAIKEAFKDAENLAEFDTALSNIYREQQLYNWDCFKLVVGEVTGCSVESSEVNRMGRTEKQIFSMEEFKEGDLFTIKWHAVTGEITNFCFYIFENGEFRQLYGGTHNIAPATFGYMTMWKEEEVHDI